MLKRLPQDQLEDESIIAVTDFFNTNTWEFNRQTRDKTGIDGEVEIIHGVERTGRFLKCQVKAGTSYISSENETHLRIKVERRYLEHWKKMSAQVLLLFYHPATHIIYWKAIKEYLDLYPNLLKQGTETCIVIYDKDQDELTPESLAAIEQVEAKKFSYSNILIEGSRTELGWSNWFLIRGFPQLWEASTRFAARSQIAVHLDRDYTYVVQEDHRLITLSDIKDEKCELRKHVDVATIRPLAREDLSLKVFVELLNQALLCLAKQHDLVSGADRFYFSASVLNSEETKTFSYISLKGSQESRQKIYVRRSGKRTENMHHAVRLSFIQHLNDWYLLIEPDWYFSYPFERRPSRREIGARITREKASTYNKNYLYLVHFWRQVLSNSTDTIRIPCSRPGDKASVEVNALPLQFEFQFRFFNDYVGPKDTTA